MSHWVRLWEDMPTDPKWRVISRRSGRPIAEVMAVFMFMMTNAGGNQKERGRLESWSDEDVSAALDIDSQHVESIREAMQGKTLEGDKLTGWEKRQPKREDNSTSRVTAWRETQRNEMKRNVTHCNAPEEKRRDSEQNTALLSSNEDSGGSSEPPPQNSDPDEREILRWCQQAAGVEFSSGFGALMDAINAGASLDGRVLPLIRQLARDGPEFKTWAYVAKAVRDPLREIPAEQKEIETVFVEQGSVHWRALCTVKRESYLNSIARTGPNGGATGVWWPKADLPMTQAGGVA